jgi:pimeloyl-ACP methyl ester carboxylesterase
MFNSWIDTWLTKENSEWNIEHYLNKITCPVLAIQGLDDNYGTPRQVYSIQKNTSGRTEILLIENCGHIPHHEARELVEKEIIKFITGI